MSVVPLYPRRSLCTRDATWDFLSTERYRGGRFFPFETLRRVDEGTASVSMNELYGELNTFGVILGRQVMRPGQEQQLLVGDPFHLMLRLLVCGNRFFRSVGYRGDVGINLTLRNMQNQRMVFIPVRPGTALAENDYRSFESVLSGQQIVAAENLEGQMNHILQSTISQVCWSFWQSADPFPNGELEEYLQRTIQNMGRL